MHKLKQWLYHLKSGVPRVLASFRVVLFLVALFGVFIYTRAGIPMQVQAATSDEINFQARLLTSTGAIVPDNTYNVEFKLYNVSTGGSALWTETYTGGSKVTVKSGYLTVRLGSLSTFPSSISWDQNHYLTMNIGGTALTPSWDGEMNPRLKLTAVPFAFASKQLSHNDGTNTGTLKFNTLTADRSIELPDETGTVCLQAKASCGFVVTGGGGAFINNQTTLQPTANFNIQSAGAGSIGARIQSANSATAPVLVLANGTTPGAGSDLLQLQDNAGLINGSINSAGNQLTLGRIAGSGTVTQGKLVLSDGTTSNFGTTLQTATLTVGSRIITIPDTAGSNDTVCLLTSGNCVGASNLQTAYNASIGGTTPEIKLEGITKKGVDIQDADTTIGATENLFAVRGSNGSGLGSMLFGVQGSGASTFASLQPATGNSADVLTAIGGKGSNTATAGNGGGIVLTSGAGGDGATVNGNGGNISLQGGAAGAGAGSAGTRGFVLLQTAGGNVGIGTATPAYLLDVDRGNVNTQTARLRSRSPNLVFDVVRSSPGDTGAAFSIVDLKATNDTATTNLITIGAFAGVTQGVAPTFNYLYFGNAYNDTALRVYANKNITLDASLGVSTTTFGTNNKLLVNPYNTVDNLATAQINTSIATNKGLVVQGYTSQSANLLEFQDSTGTQLARVDYRGNLYSQNASGYYLDTANQRGGIGTNTVLGTETFAIKPLASKEGLLIRGANTQAADLLQLQDNAGLINGSINSAGNQLTLGRIAGSGTVTQGKLVLSDGTTSNFGTTLQTATLTVGSRIITIPDTAGSNDTVCLLLSGNCNGGPTLQTAYNASAGGTTPEIVLDTTKGSLDLQNKFTGGVSPGSNLLNVRSAVSGDTTIGSTILFGVSDSGAATFTSLQPSAGNAVDVITATGGKGANTTAGGNGGGISLNSGAGGNGLTSNGNGGTISLQGGAPGSGAGLAGTYGNIKLQSSGGKVAIGVSGIPDELFSVGCSTGCFTVSADGEIINSEGINSNRLINSGLSINGTYTALRLSNERISPGDANDNVQIKFAFGNDLGGAGQALIKVGKAGDYTSDLTSSSFLAFHVEDQFVLSEAVRIISNGNMGIGDTSPAYLLTVGNGDKFGVNSSGDILLEGATVDSNKFTISVADPTANRTYTIPNSTSATDTFCLVTLGNCSSVGSSTLQTAYNASTADPTPEIVLDSTRKGVVIQDASSTVGGNLLEVSNNGGGTKYLAVTTAGTSVTGTLTSSGLLTASNALTVTTGNVTITPFSTAGIVTNNASGVLASSVLDRNSATYFNTTLSIANGGTNGTATPTNGGVSYGTGSAYAFTSAGTSGQLLKSNGAAAPTWVTATSGNTCTDCLVQAPTTTAQNTITPTVASVVGLTVNGTSGTAATALSIIQGGDATGLNVASSGTGNLAVLDTSNASANGVSIEVQSSSSSQYALNVTSNNGATNIIYARANGYVGLGTTSPSYRLTVGPGTSSSSFIGGTLGYGNVANPGIVHHENSGEASIGVLVSDGTNNRRAKLFVDNTNSVWGLMSTYSTGGNQPFVITQGNIERIRIDTNGYVGIGTSAPTHALTFPSASTGISLYNTADQTTNYERLETLWTGNVATIRVASAGTGTARDLGFKSGYSSVNSIILPGAPVAGTGIVQIGKAFANVSLATLEVGGGSTVTTPTTVKRTILGGTFNPSSSSTMSAIGVSVEPTINYVGGGAGTSTALLINPTYTAIPTGTNVGLQINTNNAGVIGQIIKGASSQSVDLQQWQDSAGAVQAKITPNGALVQLTTQDNSFGAAPITGAQLSVQPGNNARVAFLLQGVTSQAGDLMQLRGSTGLVNASFNSTGAQLTLGRIASSSTVTQGKLVFSDGTTDNYGLTLQTDDLSTTTNGKIAGSKTYSFPNSTSATDTLCLQTLGNCSSVGSSTLQTAYNASTADPTPEIVLDSTRKGVVIQDASSTVGGNLLEVSNNGGGTKYLAVTTAGTSVTGTLTSSGLLTASNALTVTTGNVTITPFSTAGIVTNNASGVLASSVLDRNSATYFNTTLSIANGGTNGTATPTNGGVSYGTGSAYAFTSAGTSGQLLKSNGAAAPTWVTATSGNTCTDCLVQAPTTTAQNTITPTVASVVGLTVNGTSGTTATAAIFNQALTGDGIALNLTSTSGTQTNGLAITRSGAGTTTNGINITQSAGTLTNGITLGGTIGTGINFGSGTYTNLISATNFSVANSGLTTLATLGTADTGTTLCRNTSNQIATCTAGTTATLQSAYTASTADPTPEIVLDSTRKGVVIQDASSTVGGNLLEVSNNGGGTKYLAVTTTGTSVTGTLTSSGLLTASNALTVTTGNVTITPFSTAGIVTNNASGVLASSVLDRNSATYFNTTLSIANGGTNGTATPTNGGVSYGTGSAYAFTSAGTSGQLLKSNGAAAPTWVTATSGNTCTDCLVQAPTTTAQNTITPTVASVVGLTVNGTSGTTATAAIFNQALTGDGIALNLTSTSGTQTNGLAITRSGAGTTTNGINITQSAGTLTNGITLGGTIGTGINFGSGTYTNLISATNFSVANSGLTTLATLGTADTGTTLCRNTSNQIATCTAGTTATLQSAYTASTADPTPEIVLDSTRKGVVIQDASSTVGGNLLEVSNNGGGTKYLAVTTAGTSVTGTLTSSGLLTASNALTVTTGNVTITPFSTAGIVTNNASGVLASSVLDRNSATYFNTTLSIANGGTNGTATPTNGGVSYGTGSAYAFTSAGTSGQLLKSNGAAAPTWVTATSGNTCTDCLVQAPTTTAQNTITPTVASVVGLTVNGTSGTTATAAIFNQALTGDGIALNLTSTSGTQTNGLAITRNGSGGTTTNLLNLTNTAGTITNAINLSGTYTNLINSANFSVTNAGAGTFASNLAVNGGSITSTAATLLIDTTTAGTVTIGTTATTVNISTGASTTNAVNIASGATAVNTTQIGTTNGASTTRVQGGTGSGAVHINSGSGGTVNIGNAGLAGTVQIGNTTGGVAQTINLGNNSTASSTTTINIGSTIGTSPLNFNSGSSGTIFRGTNGTTSLQIQNSGGADTLLSSNTTNNRIKIGNSTGTDTDTTLLVLDSSTTDPTTNIINGSTYYNTSSNKFRCYQASAWTDCIGTGSGGASTLQQAYDGDIDGGDASIALNSADGSLIVSNPASGGTTSGFLIQSGNAATGSSINNFKNINITQTGSYTTAGGNLTNYAGYFSNASSESAGANTLTNVGLYATASGADNNYSAIFESGSVGIGTTAPTATLNIQNTSTTAVIIQKGGASTALFTADTSTNMVIKIGTGSAGVITTTGSGNLVVTNDTEIQGRLVVGNTTNNIDTTGNAFRFKGLYRNSIVVSLKPEYEGAIFSATAPNNTTSGSNVGTLTSDICSNAGSLNVNSAKCFTNEHHSFYEWTHNETTDQDYYIYVRYRIPDNFDGSSAAYLAGEVSFKGFSSKSASSVDNKAEISLYNSAGNQCGSTTNITNGTANRWGAGTVISGVTNSANCTAITAGTYVTLAIKLTANSTGSTGEVIRMGAIEFAYKALY